MGEFEDSERKNPHKIRKTYNKSESNQKKPLGKRSKLIG
jgi:hypothetical protein